MAHTSCYQNNMPINTAMSDNRIVCIRYYHELQRDALDKNQSKTRDHNGIERSQNIVQKCIELQIQRSSGSERLRRVVS